MWHSYIVHYGKEQTKMAAPREAQNNSINDKIKINFCCKNIDGNDHTKLTSGNTFSLESVQANFSPLYTCHGENLINLVPFKYMSWRKSYQFVPL